MGERSFKFYPFRSLMFCPRLPKSSTVCILLHLLFFCILSTVSSQYFEFKNLQVPESKHIVSLSRYFTYVPDDPPALSINGIPIGLSPITSLSTFPLFATITTPNHSTQQLHVNDHLQKVTPNPSLVLLSNSHHLRLRQLQQHNNLQRIVYQLEGPLRYSNKGADIQQGNSLPNRKLTEIVFDNLRISSFDSPVQNNSIQVSLLSYNDFFATFFPNALDEKHKFCCDEELYFRGGCKVLNQLVIPPGIETFKSIIVSDSSPMNSNPIGFELSSSDMYILFFSNCGMSETNAKVSGAVYLKNYFGFLPGIEAPKVSFYALLIGFYILLLLIWGCLALFHRSHLIHIHMAIAIVLGFCLLESLIWFGFYRHWNNVPKRSTLFLGTSIVITVVKNILAFMLVLVASLGWGITKPILPTTTKRKILLIICAYVIFDSAR